MGSSVGGITFPSSVMIRSTHVAFISIFLIYTLVDTERLVSFILSDRYVSVIKKDYTFFNNRYIWSSCPLRFVITCSMD